MQINNETRWSDLFSPSNRASAIALCGGVILHAINIFLATTILPSVVEDIGGLNLYAWNTTLFVVASIIGSTLSARLLSARGPRGAYLLATLFFALGSTLCALAPSMSLMLLGRTVQGFGGGFLFALSYAMINLVFHSSLWPRAMALISAMWGIATLMGPAIGGIFAELHAWRWAFGVLLPIAIIYGFFTYRILPKGQASNNSASGIPVTQLALLVTAVMVVSAASLISDPRINVAGVVLALFLVWVISRKEAVSRTRLLPKNALRPGSPHIVLYATLVLLIIGLACEIYIPYFLQTLHGQSPLASGYIAATMSAGWTASEIMSSGWKGRAMRFSVISGPVLILLGLLGLSWLMPQHTLGSWLTLTPMVVGFTAIGFGIGFGWPHLLTRILQVSSEEDKEIAGASITTVQMFATALGAALAGTIANLSGLTESGQGDGVANAAFWLFLLLAIAPLLAIYTATRAAALPEEANAHH